MISRRNMLKTVAAALATVAVPLPTALPSKPGEGRIVQAAWVIGKPKPIDVRATAEQIMSASKKLVARHYVKEIKL